MYHNKITKTDLIKAIIKLKPSYSEIINILYRRYNIKELNKLYRCILKEKKENGEKN